MKKLLIILLCFTMIPAITVFGAFDVVEADYEYTINNDHWFNLSTGVYEYNVDYNTTNRIAIKYDSINLSSLTSFHHLLFFNHNEYLGYYNSQAGFLEIGDKFLGQINTFTPTIPSNATHFVIQNYNNYKNLVPIAELNNKTLLEVFDGENIINYNTISTYNSTYNIINDILEITAGGIDNTFTLTMDTTIQNIIGKTYYSRIKYVYSNGVINMAQFKTAISTNVGGSDVDLTLRNNVVLNAEYVDSGLGSVITNDNNLRIYLNGVLDNAPLTDGIKITVLDWVFVETNLTKQEMDYWFNVFESNLDNDIYYSGYIDLNITNPYITYIYQKEIPDDTPPLDKIDNFLDDLGIGSKGFKLFISIAVIAITMILLVMGFKAQALIVIIAASLELVLFVFMGWVPNYVIIVLAVLLFILIIKERSGNNEA